MDANNTAALRKVVELVAHLNDDGYWNRSMQICNIVAKAQQALVAPPRNCDVGTVEEQAQRFRAICESVKPAEPNYSETGEVLCPSIGSGQECELGICNFGQCALKWAQIPYKKVEDNGGK